jgi:hypothetical protein
MPCYASKQNLYRYSLSYVGLNLLNLYLQKWPHLIHVSETEIVSVYVCSELENAYMNLHQTSHAYSLRPGRDYRKVKILKNYPEFESQGGWFL